MKVSAHFDVDEFAQPAKHGQPAAAYPSYWISDPTRLVALVGALETIRAIWNRPITILSGYRTPQYNAALYADAGKQPTNSQHSQGRAADIQISDIPTFEIHQKILNEYQAGRLKIGGLGYYPSQNFVHIDVRIGWNHLAQWTEYGG